MNPKTELALTRQEQYTLTLVVQRVNALMADYPNVARKHYSFVEVIPDYVLTPETVRAAIRYELADSPRAFALEQYIVERIQINGHDFLEWEANPGVIGAE